LTKASIESSAETTNEANDGAQTLRQAAVPAAHEPDVLRAKERGLLILDINNL
jgi:hypothetical protein